MFVTIVIIVTIIITIIIAVFVTYIVTIIVVVNVVAIKITIIDIVFAITIVVSLSPGSAIFAIVIASSEASVLHPILQKKKVLISILVSHLYKGSYFAGVGM